MYIYLVTLLTKTSSSDAIAIAIAIPQEKALEHIEEHIDVTEEEQSKSGFP